MLTKVDVRGPDLIDASLISLTGGQYEVPRNGCKVENEIPHALQSLSEEEWEEICQLIRSLAESGNTHAVELTHKINGLRTRRLSKSRYTRLVLVALQEFTVKLIAECLHRFSTPY